MEMTPRMKRSAAAARNAAAQSYVLLKNIRQTLPLTAPTEVALFGIGQIFSVRGGTGSGKVNLIRETNLLDGLKAAGALVPNALLARKYRSWALAHPDCTEVNFLMPDVHFNPEMPLSEVEWDALDGIDTALIVISRTAGEGADMQYGPGSIALTKEEIDLIHTVCGRFPRTVLLLNTPGYVELEEVFDELGAIVFVGLPGQEGAAALSDVLTGVLSPSGHLSDTWPKRYADYPLADYYGGGTENGIEHTGMMGPRKQIDVPYHDDIYVGYRYFDTFGTEVRFPFGYGLTYGAPKLTAYSVCYADGTVTVTVTVANDSERYACREVAQVYVSVPEGKLEQPYTRLAAFGKTGELSPGGSETLTLSFPLRDLASWDTETHSYVLESGYYYVRVGFSSRDTCVAGALYLPNTVVTQVLSNRIGTLPEDFSLLSNRGAAPITYPGEAEELEAAKRLAIRVPVRDLPTERAVYPKAFGGCERRKETATLYDVRNGDASLQDVAAAMTDEELCRMVCGMGMDMSAFANMEHGPGGPDGEEKDAFMPMPDFSQSVAFATPGCAGETPDFWEEYRIPRTELADGPAGLRLNIEVKDEEGTVVHRQICTAFPTGSLLACSWDPEVLRSVGEAVGTEMNELQVDLWLAPGMNLHRSPLCGRNFEYYSEDPLLCGRCAAAITKGVQSCGGGGVTLKHFAGNNQEYLRDCSNDIVSERAMRELYLKGFEIAVRESAPKAIMTSYNDICGVPAANNYDLCTAILRGEWGFGGLVMTDWGGGISHPALSMWAGNDMIQPGGDTYQLLMDALGKEIANPGVRDFSVTLTRAMIEQCAVRILAFVLQSESFRRRVRGI